MMRLIATVLGSLLCLTGIIGFFSQQFMGMLLNPLHDCFLLVMGAISLYFGTQGTDFQARNMCKVLGVMFGLLGIATLLAGPGSSTIAGLSLTADHFLKLIPGHLEYSTADGVRDLITGLVGLLGFLPRQQEIELEDKVSETRQKVAGGRR